MILVAFFLLLTNEYLLFNLDETIRHISHDYASYNIDNNIFSFTYKDLDMDVERVGIVAKDSIFVLPESNSSVSIRPKSIIYQGNYKTIFISNNELNDKFDNKLMMCDYESFSCEVLTSKVTDKHYGAYSNDFYEVVKIKNDLMVLFTSYNGLKLKYVRIDEYGEKEFGEFSTGRIADVAVDENHIYLSIIDSRIDTNIANHAYQGLFLDVYDIQNMTLQYTQRIQYGLDYHVQSATIELLDDRAFLFYTQDEDKDQFSFFPDVIYMRVFDIQTNTVSERFRLFNSWRIDGISGITQIESFQDENSVHVLFGFNQRRHTPHELYLIEVNKRDLHFSEPAMVLSDTREGFDYSINDNMLNIYFARMSVDRLSTNIYRKEVELREVEFEYDLASKIVIQTNYPNPFNSSTTLKFSLYESQNIDLEVYDNNGRIVYHNHLGNLPKGNHLQQITLPQNLSTGMYIYRLRSQNHSADGQVFLVK